MKKLLRIKHGLGDNCQATIVINHLKHYHPDWFLGVEALPGSHSCFYGVADAVHVMRHPFTWRQDYDEILNLDFPRPTKTYPNVPSTKPTRCLEEVFNLDPIESLYRYTINPTPEATTKVDQFIEEELHGQPYAVLHYLGTNSKADKDLTHYEATLWIYAMLKEGLAPVLLDWDRQSPCAKFTTVTCPDKRHPYLWDGERVGDAGTIHQLIDRAEYFVGIDSGPAHVAAATNTPAYVFWVNHTPIHCFDLADNVIHFVPHFSRDLIAGDRDSAWEYFTANYQHRVYDCDLTEYIEFLAVEICAALA